jgi:hypothetical protein
MGGGGRGGGGGGGGPVQYMTVGPRSGNALNRRLQKLYVAITQSLEGVVLL